MKKLIPINDYVIVKLKDVELKQTKGGLYIPVTKNTNVNEAVIVCSSEKNEQVKEGDSIIAQKCGTPFYYEGVDGPEGIDNVLAIREIDIIAKFEDE